MSPSRWREIQFEMIYAVEKFAEAMDKLRVAAEEASRREREGREARRLANAKRRLEEHLKFKHDYAEWKRTRESDGTSRPAS